MIDNQHLHGPLLEVQFQAELSVKSLEESDRAVGIGEVAARPAAVGGRMVSICIARTAGIPFGASG